MTSNLYNLDLRKKTNKIFSQKKKLYCKSFLSDDQETVNSFVKLIKNKAYKNQ